MDADHTRVITPACSCELVAIQDSLVLLGDGCVQGNLLAAELIVNDTITGPSDSLVIRGSSGEGTGDQLVNDEVNTEDIGEFTLLEITASTDEITVVDVVHVGVAQVLLHLWSDSQEDLVVGDLFGIAAGGD